MDPSGIIPISVLQRESTIVEHNYLVFSFYYSNLFNSCWKFSRVKSGGQWIVFMKLKSVGKYKSTIISNIENV
jgi:hypothetical protein